MISFPGLNLSFDVKPVAVNLFGVPIYWYAICIVVAIVVALVLCYKSKEKFDIEFDFLFSTLLVAIIFGFVGARVYYVVFNLGKYINSPLKIFNIRDGGLAIYGGLVAGGLVIIHRCKKFKVSRLDFFDYLAPFVALGQAIGRWGNFFNQEAYGTETYNLLRMGINTAEGYKEVHPAFLYESISNFLIFLILRKCQKNRKFKGEIVYLYLFLYSGARMLIEGIRMDSLMFENFRISQILSIAIFVISGIMLLKNYIKYKYNIKKC